MEGLVILKNPVLAPGCRTVGMIMAPGRIALLRKQSANMLLATLGNG